MLTKRQLIIEWYHGDERKTDFINRNHFDVTDYSRDRNAMGPGIYFTNLKYQASGYAGDSGYVYTVTVDLDPKRTLEDNTKPNKEILKKFVDRCPDEEMLYNYAEDLSVARRLAVEMNMDSKNLLEAIMGIYNDLYQKDAVLFAKVMTEVGYDAFYHKVNPKYPDAIHLIVYNPSIINIVKEEHKGIKESKNNMKHIKLFESFLNEERKQEYYIIGHTKSGKPIYDAHDHPSHKHFTSEDHTDASKEHNRNSKREEHHLEQWDKHAESAYALDLGKFFKDSNGKHPKVGDFITIEDGTVGMIKKIYKENNASMPNGYRMTVDLNASYLDLNPKSKFTIIEPDEKLEKIFK